MQVHCQNIFQKMNMKSASCCRSICVSVRICVRKCIIYCIFYVDLGWRKQYVGILEAKEDGIQYYFIDNEFYFAGDRPYNNIYEDVEKICIFLKGSIRSIAAYELPAGYYSLP